MSPEQIIATERLDFRTDIYSLGASLYHLVTKNILFNFSDPQNILRAHVEDDYQAVDPRVFNRKITSGFVHLIQKMLIKDRDNRYRSWKEVLSDAKILETTKILPEVPEHIISSLRILN
jgi:serine/threonine protein kinase